MTDPDQVRIRWAPRVSPNKIRRLYDSDAQGRLDEELLDDVGYGIYTRVCDMFQVREAINGRVACRTCGTILSRKLGMGRAGKMEVLACPQCGWQITWRAYSASYTGKSLLFRPARAAFEHFYTHWPDAATPAAKMLLIDRLIHEFHVNQGITWRPVGENVIEGNVEEVRALIEGLAYGPRSTQGTADPRAWAAAFDDPIRVFRHAHAWAEIEALAGELDIPGRSKLSQDDLVAEIRRLRPELFDTDGGSTAD